MSGEIRGRLVLFDYMCDLFGFDSFDDFQELLSDRTIEEGFGEEGHSDYYYALRSHSADLKIPLEKLERYDLNIKEYTKKLNRKRHDPITLKYFQYLSVLFSEIYLDKFFNNRQELLEDLNSFVDQRNEESGVDILDDDYLFGFEKTDLKKLAYWMATGSGKTLIMHINLWQFLRYNEEALDNILLITPDERMTSQHIEDMGASGIEAEEFSEGVDMFGYGEKEKVDVIDIHKLKEERGEKTVSVESFEGNNLVFVDEGHMGATGDTWMAARKSVVGEGFVFEYSATFGQAFSGSENSELVEDYTKSIVMDYSYPHFYEDGYGKDYDILNLPDDESLNAVYEMMMGNLLSFYEQMRYFDEYESELEDHNIKRPLWLFVGSKVLATYERDGREFSDITTVLSFIQKFSRNDGNWAVNKLDDFLNRRLVLPDKDGKGIFAGKFRYLQSKGDSPSEIFRDILQRVFNASVSSNLRLFDLNSSQGEVGLKIGQSNNFFGVINVGDSSKLIDLTVEHVEGVDEEEEHTIDSLFNTIKLEDSQVNLLIGSKKFTQGWDTWRVSNMGLLRVGRGEGPEIIQLFGRGVRLLGKNRSLKRSSTSGTNAPKYIDLLETLQIFGVKADYMAKFKDYLEKEGVVTEFWKEAVEIKIDEEYLQKGLKVPDVHEGKNFKKETILPLEVSGEVTPSLDLYPTVERIHSDGAVTLIDDQRTKKSQEIREEVISLLDWNEIYFDLLDFKKTKGYQNLIIDKQHLKKIIADGHYSLFCPDDRIHTESFEDLNKLTNLSKTILRKYVDGFYKQERQVWENNFLEYRPIEKDDSNFKDYSIKIPKDKEDLILDIEKLIEDRDKLLNEDIVEPIQTIYFEKHLFKPLLVKHNEVVDISPAALNKGERQFVYDLRMYLTMLPENHEVASKEIFLLRNAERRGIGFFEAGNFYPDFILWILDEDNQHIIFIDPHGLINIVQKMNIKNYSKVKLHSTIKDIETRIGENSVTLDSFILHPKYQSTKEDVLKIIKSDGQQMTGTDLDTIHVLFQEDTDNIEKIFSLSGYSSL